MERKQLLEPHGREMWGGSPGQVALGQSQPGEGEDTHPPCAARAPMSCTQLEGGWPVDAMCTGQLSRAESWQLLRRETGQTPCGRPKSLKSGDVRGNCTD